MAEEKNVEKLHQKRYNDLIDSSINLFLSKDKKNPDELKAVVEQCIKYLLGDNNWILGIDYWMLWNYQTGDFLEKAIFREFGITREFQNNVLTDEQLKAIASMAETARYNSYFTNADYIKGVQSILPGCYVLFYYNKIFIFCDISIDDLILKACFFYNFIPKKLTYITFLIKKPITNELYFWMPALGCPFPQGYTGFISLEGGVLVRFPPLTEIVYMG